MNFFLRTFIHHASYDTLPVDIRKRIPFVIYVTEMMIVFFAFSASLKVLENTAVNLSFGIAVGLTSLGFIVALLIMKSGAHELSSLVTIVCLFLNLQWMGFLLPVVGSFDSYRYLTYEIATVIVVSLVAFRSVTMLAYGLACTVGLVVLNLTAIAGHEQGVTRDILTVMGFGVILLLTITFVSMQAARFTAQLVSIAKEEEARSHTRFARLRELIIGSQTSFDIGQTILETTTTNLQRAQHLGGNARTVHELMQQLAESSERTASSSQEILRQTALMRKGIDESHLAINTTMTGVTEIMATIGNIAASAKQKRTSIQGLVGVLDGQKDEIEQVRHSIRGMVDSSRQFETIIATIGDIAEQTSLLAMNASIEAAHAGESGKGFAVIAGQVKKLSESARNSTSQVAGILAGNTAALEKGGRLIEGIISYFTRLGEQVRLTIDSVEEVLGGLGEIAKGTDGIHASTDHLVRLSESNAGMVADTEAHTRNAGKESEKLFAAIQASRSAIDDMMVDLAAITQALRELSEAGQQNIRSLNQLNEGIGAISSD